jgi:hypothetical protein
MIKWLKDRIFPPPPPPAAEDIPWQDDTESLSDVEKEIVATCRKFFHTRVDIASKEIYKNSDIEFIQPGFWGYNGITVKVRAKGLRPETIIVVFQTVVTRLR